MMVLWYLNVTILTVQCDLLPTEAIHSRLILNLTLSSHVPKSLCEALKLSLGRCNDVATSHKWPVSFCLFM